MRCLSPLKAGVSVFLCECSRCIQWLVMKVKVELVVYPEVTGSVKSRKWISHKLFSLLKREKFITFFKFCIL